MTAKENEQRWAKIVEEWKEIKVEHQIDSAKRAVHDLVDYQSDEEFAERVEKEVDKRRRLCGSGPLKCFHCPKAFQTKWELNRHIGDAH